jgi:hypothetical protein
VQIVDIKTGDIVEWIRLEGGVTELFDVRVLPGVRRPKATGLHRRDPPRISVSGRNERKMRSANARF